MARTADHDRRRLQLSRAARDVALREGIARVSIARVAAQAGVSVGLVQHYFSSKELLMRRAYEDLLAEADERVAEVVRTGEAHAVPIREMVVGALSELLPLDAPRVAECLVRAEFQVLSARLPDLRAVTVEQDRAFRARLAHVVENGKACGETDAGADPSAVAAEVWAALTGAMATHLADPEFPSVRVVAAAAARDFPHPCRLGDQRR